MLTMGWNLIELCLGAHLAGSGCCCNPWVLVLQLFVLEFLGHMLNFQSSLHVPFPSTQSRRDKPLEQLLVHTCSSTELGNVWCESLKWAPGMFYWFSSARWSPGRGVSKGLPRAAYQEAVYVRVTVARGCGANSLCVQLTQWVVDVAVDLYLSELTELGVWGKAGRGW